MSIAAPERTQRSPKTYTPEELLRLPDGGKGFELVDGRLVEKNMGGFASYVALRLGSRLVQFGEDRGLGCAFDSEGSYQCFPDAPRKVRKPDLSFIRRGRLPDEVIPSGHIKIPPDLAVEVVSPNDTAYEVDGKVVEYLGAGVPLVWVVYPETRSIHVYRSDGTASRLGENENLTAPELMPDFSVRVGDLFPLPVQP
jgi:Uma2 family endonuclease